MQTEETRDGGAIADLLTIEIRDLDTAAQRAGWTQWALTSAVAYLAWVALGVLPEVQSLPASLGLYAGLSVILWSGMKGLPSRKSATDNTDVRFVNISRLVAESRLSIAAIVLEVASWTAAGVYWAVSGAQRIPILLLVFSALLTLILLLVAVSPWILPVIPEPKTSSQSKLAALGPGIVLGLGLASGSHLLAAVIGSRTAGLPEWKFAFLLTGACVLLAMFAGQGRTSPLRDELVAVRRRLLLGEIPATDAKERLDLALKGLTLKHAFGISVDAIVREDSARKDAVSRAAASLSALRNEIEKLAAAPSEETWSAVPPLLETLGKDMRDTAARHSSLRTKVSRLVRQCVLILRVNPSCKVQVTDFAGMVETAVSEGDTQCAKLFDDFDRLRTYVATAGPKQTVELDPSA